MAQSDATGGTAPTARQAGIDLLAAIATAELGPLGGLIVRMGAPAALEAVAAHRGKRAEELSDAEVRLAARELLERPAFAAVAAAAEERARGG